MLDGVDLEEAGRFMGVCEPGEDGDGAAADFLEFVGEHIGQVIFFSEPDEVKVLPEEGRE
jgi:hypothetical protein